MVGIGAQVPGAAAERFFTSERLVNDFSLGPPFFKGRQGSGQRAPTGLGGAQQKEIYRMKRGPQKIGDFWGAKRQGPAEGGTPRMRRKDFRQFICRKSIK